MIVGYSFSRFTTRMKVHDSFSVSCFPRTSAGWFQMAALSSSLGSTAASEIRRFIFKMIIMTGNIEDQDKIQKISSEESVYSEELE